MKNNFFVNLSCGFWKAVGKTKFSKWGYRFLRQSLLWLHLIKHNGKQRFYLGKLKKNKTRKQFVSHLRKNGFEKDYYAWVDDGEILSMRKMHEDFFQYHIRLHKDREIRGHYEYAPDRRPLKHFFRVFQFARIKYFRKMLGGFLE